MSAGGGINNTKPGRSAARDSLLHWAGNEPVDRAMAQVDCVSREEHGDAENSLLKQQNSSTSFFRIYLRVACHLH